MRQFNKASLDASSRPVPIDHMSSSEMAIKVLETSVGKTVLIKLKGGKVIRGSLQGFDQHMNLSLEGAEEINLDGKQTTLGTLIVRGDNIIMISPPPG